MHRTGLLFGMLGAVASLQGLAYAHHQESPNADPKELGRVAIMPFVDLSGEQDEDKQQYRATALAEVEKRFRMYDVVYVPPEEMQSALAALKLDPSDEEDRGHASMKALADYLRVRYVVVGTLYDASSGWSHRGFFGDEKKAGRAKVQIRVFDSTEGRFEESLEATVTATARAKAFSSGLFSRSRKLRVKAVKDATKDALLPFLKPYPKAHDEDPGGSSDDSPQVARKGSAASG